MRMRRNPRKHNEYRCRARGNHIVCTRERQFHKNLNLDREESIFLSEDFYKETAKIYMEKGFEGTVKFTETRLKQEFESIYPSLEKKGASILGGRSLNDSPFLLALLTLVKTIIRSSNKISEKLNVFMGFNPKENEIKEYYLVNYDLHKALFGINPLLNEYIEQEFPNTRLKLKYNLTEKRKFKTSFTLALDTKNYQNLYINPILVYDVFLIQNDQSLSKEERDLLMEYYINDNLTHEMAHWYTANWLRIDKMMIFILVTQNLDALRNYVERKHDYLSYIELLTDLLSSYFKRKHKSLFFSEKFSRIAEVYSQNYEHYQKHYLFGSRIGFSLFPPYNNQLPSLSLLNLLCGNDYSTIIEIFSIPKHRLEDTFKIIYESLKRRFESEGIVFRPKKEIRWQKIILYFPKLNYSAISQEELGKNFRYCLQMPFFQIAKIRYFDLAKHYYYSSLVFLELILVFFFNDDLMRKKFLKISADQLSVKYLYSNYHYINIMRKKEKIRGSISEKDVNDVQKVKESDLEESQYVINLYKELDDLSKKISKKITEMKKTPEGRERLKELEKLADVEFFYVRP